jgi:hypothetical protein
MLSVTNARPSSSTNPFTDSRLRYLPLCCGPHALQTPDDPDAPPVTPVLPRSASSRRNNHLNHRLNRDKVVHVSCFQLCSQFLFIQLLRATCHIGCLLGNHGSLPKYACKSSILSGSGFGHLNPAISGWVLPTTDRRLARNRWWAVPTLQKLSSADHSLRLLSKTGVIAVPGGFDEGQQIEDLLFRQRVEQVFRHRGCL